MTIPRLSLLILAVILSCKSDKAKAVKPIEINFTKEAELVFIHEKDTIAPLDIELAESEYEQQTGLMHRDAMDMNQGMLFVYEDEKQRPNFYMKNTEMALDLIYINSNYQIIEIHKNAKPFDETPINANQPAQYVLEVNAGFVEKYNISDRFKVSFHKL